MIIDSKIDNADIIVATIPSALFAFTSLPLTIEIIPKIKPIGLNKNVNINANIPITGAGS